MHFANIQDHSLWLGLRMITKQKYIFHNDCSKPRANHRRECDGVQGKAMEMEDLNSACKKHIF